MIVCSLNFVAVSTIVKIIGTDVPASQSAFLRYLLGLMFIIPMLGSFRHVRVVKKDMIVFGFRGLFHSLGVMLWFFAMTQITIAEVTSMNYLTPVFLSVAAILFLGEALSVSRMIALLVALVGGFLILRPGLREVVAGHWAMFGTVSFFTVSYLMAKQLTERYSAEIIVVMLSISCTVCLLPAALLVWKNPTWEQMFWLFLVAFFATFAHYSMTRAFNTAPITVTQPFNFLQLIWATVIGALFFSEPVDLWVLLGGGTIVGSISVLAWHEFVRKRRPS